MTAVTGKLTHKALEIVQQDEPLSSMIRTCILILICTRAAPMLLPKHKANPGFRLLTV